MSKARSLAVCRAGGSPPGIPVQDLSLTCSSLFSNRKREREEVTREDRASISLKHRVASPAGYGERPKVNLSVKPTQLRMRGQLGGRVEWGEERDYSGEQLPGSVNQLPSRKLTAFCQHTRAQIVQLITGPDPTGQAEYRPKLDQILCWVILQWG